jgi:hypothetical protein
LEDQLLLFKGTNQKVLDIINPETSGFSRIALPSDFFLENSAVRLISVSADARYISLAGSSGFAHLSTATGRWRSLDILDQSLEAEETFDDIPHVRGGMCWYGNILLIGGEFGDKHEVCMSDLTLLTPGSSLSPECFEHEFALLATQRILSFLGPLDVLDRQFTAGLLSRQYSISFLGGTLY